jgi:hypothetical protein
MGTYKVKTVLIVVVAQLRLLVLLPKSKTLGGPCRLAFVR